MRAAAHAAEPRLGQAAFLAGPRPEHAWTPCPGRAFHVRQPNSLSPTQPLTPTLTRPTPCPCPNPNATQVRQPNYARTALKAPSLEAMYEVVAQDTFLCPDAKLPHVARLLERTLTPSPHTHPNLHPKP